MDKVGEKKTLSAYYIPTLKPYGVWHHILYHLHLSGGKTLIISLYSVMIGFYNRDSVFTARYGLNIQIYLRLVLIFKTLVQCKKPHRISLLAHHLKEGFNNRQCVYCAVRAEYLSII